MTPHKGDFWRHGKEHVWVRFVFEVDGETFHFLEYQPKGVVPYRGSEKSHEEDEDFPHWKKIGVQEAQAVIVNMQEQDDVYAYRLGKKAEAEKLMAALKILERKRISSVEMADNAIRVNTENGASYEISVTRDGYASRQTGLPDPSW